MKRYPSILIILSIFVFFSCDKSVTEENYNIYGKWNVTEFLSVESVAYPKDKNFNPVIEFKKDGSYSLKLDRNSCSGSFTLTEENNISISAAGCTKICCDSEFSKKFTVMLPQVTDYSIEANRLKMNVDGWGWIVLDVLK